MAAERTYFAWLRTGLQAIGVSLAVGRVIPALIDTSNVAYVLLGLGYGVLGGFLVCYALVRARQLETAPRHGDAVGMDGWAPALVTGSTLVLVVATCVMVLESLWTPLSRLSRRHRQDHAAPDVPLPVAPELCSERCAALAAAVQRERRGRLGLGGGARDHATVGEVHGHEPLDRPQKGRPAARAATSC